MTDYSTEYTLQELENNLADKTVNPPVLRRGLLGKASDGKYYNIAVNTDGTLIEGLPTSGNNASLTATEVIVGDVTTTTIEKVIGIVTYTKTVVETASTGVTTISEWS